MWEYMDAYEDNKDIKNIEYVKGLYEQQKEKVRNEKFMENLLLEEYVRAIRKNWSKYDYLTIFKDAQKERDEKLKKNRKNIDTLEKFIINDFLGGDTNFKLTNIISCGYENYAWAIEFEGYGKTFRIDIPIKANLNTENVKYANHGMFAFIVNTSACSWTLEFKSYKIEEVSAAISKYFEQVKSEQTL